MRTDDRFHWLLRFEIDGRPYRYAVERVDVPSGAKQMRYRGGLGDLEVQLGAASVSISIADAAVDWPALADRMEAVPAELRRLRVGDDLALAELYVAGELAGLSIRARSEPLSFTLAQAAGSAAPGGLGLRMPDPLAKVDEHTWPIDVAATSVEDGKVYPVVFGAPGDLGATALGVMPIGLAQFGVVPQTLVVVGEDGALTKATSVFIRNDTLSSEGFVTVTKATDLLGRRVAVAELTGGLEPASATQTPRLYAGFRISDGGGVARSLDEVLIYVLERFGPANTDWAQIRAAAPELSIFQVDTWIDDPVEDPWDWIEETFLSHIPYEVRQGARGRYLIRQRFTPRRARARQRLQTNQGVERLSRWTRGDTSPLNEFTANYRRTVSNEWIGQVVLTGRADEVLSATTGVSSPVPTGNQVVTVLTNKQCQQSLTTFRGVRQAPPVNVDWTWDTGTIVEILEWMAERDAVPDWTATYAIRGGHILLEGDTILLTDPEFGLVEEPCLVEDPPVVDRTPWANVVLRRRAR